MNEEVEKIIKKLGCRDKHCEHFIENGVWTFCSAILQKMSVKKFMRKINNFSLDKIR